MKDEKEPVFKLPLTAQQFLDAARRDPSARPKPEDFPEGFPPAAAEAFDAVKASFGDVVTAVAEAWTKVKPVIEAVARDQATQAAALAALAECFVEDDDTEAEARKRLAGLDAGQLKDAENATVALSLIVSRMRKELDERGDV